MQIIIIIYLAIALIVFIGLLVHVEVSTNDSIKSLCKAVGSPISTTVELSLSAYSG